LRRTPPSLSGCKTFEAAPSPRYVSSMHVQASQRFRASFSACRASSHVTHAHVIVWRLDHQLPSPLCILPNTARDSGSLPAERPAWATLGVFADTQAQGVPDSKRHPLRELHRDGAPLPLPPNHTPHPISVICKFRASLGFYSVSCWSRNVLALKAFVHVRLHLISV